MASGTDHGIGQRGHLVAGGVTGPAPHAFIATLIGCGVVPGKMTGGAAGCMSRAIGNGIADPDVAA